MCGRSGIRGNGPADTPGSVRVHKAPWTAIYLGTTLPQPSSGLPGNSASSLSVPCLTLLRTRFTEPTRSPWPLVVSYTTVSPLPPVEPKPYLRRSVFCGTVSRVAPGGCYPPSCSMEPGRSSASAAHEEQRMTRPSCRPIPNDPAYSQPIRRTAGVRSPTPPCAPGWRRSPGRTRRRRPAPCARTRGRSR